MQQKRKWAASVWIRGGMIILGAGMIMLAGAFIAVDLIRSGAESKSPDDLQAKQGNIAEQVKAQQDNIVLLGGAWVTYEYRYTLCGHTKTATKPATPGMIGLSREEIQKAYPELQISAFSPTSFTAKVNRDLYCPDHYILRAVDGKADIYQTNQDSGTVELTMKLSIPLDGFDTDRVEDIKKGIPFDTLESLEEFLDDQEV